MTEIISTILFTCVLGFKTIGALVYLALAFALYEGKSKISKVAGCVMFVAFMVAIIAINA